MRDRAPEIGDCLQGKTQVFSPKVCRPLVDTKHLKGVKNQNISQSYQVSKVPRLEVGLGEELLDAGDADGAGAAPGNVVVLLQPAGPVVQRPALKCI